MFTRLSLLGFELRVLLNRCQRRILTTMYQYSLEPQSHKMPMQTQKRAEVTTAEVVVGTTHLYRADGTIRLIPVGAPTLTGSCGKTGADHDLFSSHQMPSPDPKGMSLRNKLGQGHFTIEMN